MGIHIGEKIRQRAKELRIGPTELGKMIHTSKQNVAGIYKRKSIDAELLQKLSTALDCNFFDYYTSSGNSPFAKEGKVIYKSGKKQKPSKNKQITELVTELHFIKKRLDDIFKELSELKK